MGLKKNIVRSVIILSIVILLYLLFWPVPIDPQPWQAPVDAGYTGVFVRNERLAAMATLPLGGTHGPEDVAVDDQGRIYASTREGWIVRLAADGSEPQNWVNTGGWPLGIVFDKQGNLIVADAARGLLRITPAGQVEVLATEADGTAIGYANNVDAAVDGKIYFSDSSSKFSPRAFGGSYPASLLDIMEHGGHGRLLVYDPLTGKATTLLSGLNFANGVAIGPDQTYVLVNETSNYRILRYWLVGSRAGTTDTFIENLPGFPDNLTTGRNGRFWVALVAPRNPLLDGLAEQPWLRKVVQRLPDFLRPRAVSYGHVIALDGEGKVTQDLQDPAGTYPLLTAVSETEDYLYFGSLVAPAVGRLAKTKLGL